MKIHLLQLSGTAWEQWARLDIGNLDILQKAVYTENEKYKPPNRDLFA